MWRWIDPTAKHGLGALILLLLAGASFVAGVVFIGVSIFALFGAEGVIGYNIVGRLFVITSFALLGWGLVRVCWVALGAMHVRIPALRLGLSVVPLVAIVAFVSQIRLPAPPPVSYLPPAPVGSPGLLRPWTDLDPPFETPPPVASVAQRQAAANVLQQYFDQRRLILDMPYDRGNPIGATEVTPVILHTLVADGDVRVDAASATLLPPDSPALERTYPIGHYRVLGVDSIEKLPSVSNFGRSAGTDFDVVRVRYHRVLETTPFGDRLLANGWKNDAPRLTLTSTFHGCNRFCDPPGGFNAAAKAPVGSVATLVYRRWSDWTAQDVDETEVATRSIAPQTVFAAHTPPPTPIPVEALAPYVAHADALQSFVNGFLGLPAFSRSPAPTEPAQPSTAALAEAGLVVEAGFKGKPFTIGPPNFGPSRSAQDAVMVQALQADGDVTTDPKTGTVSLNEKGKALMYAPGSMITGAYHVDGVDGLERLPNGNLGIDCLLVHYRRSVALNAVGTAVQRAGYPFTYQKFSTGAVTATIINQQGQGWGLGQMDADTTDPRRACSEAPY